MKILLIDPPNTRRLIPTSIVHVPLGLGYIAAYVQKQIEYCLVHIIQMSNPMISINNLLRQINLEDYNFIGVTVYHWNRKAVKTILKHVKRNYPSTVTLIGGPEASLDRNLLNFIEYADYCIIGEGELTLIELIKYFESKTSSKKDLKKINGIAFKDFENDVIIRSPKRKLIEELDSCPSPYLTNIFNLEKYDSAIILTARGCPKKCIFCACGAMFGHKVRFYSISRVLKEIDIIVESGIKRLIISDDTFTINKQRANKILDEIIKRKYSDLKVWCETRVDRVDQHLLLKMRKAGIQSLGFGLESGSEHILRSIKKDITLDEFYKAVNLAKKVGLQVSVSFILGLPGESFKDAIRTIEVAEKANADLYIVNIFLPFPGTEAWNKKEEFGIIIDKDNTVWEPYSHTNKLSISDLNELKALALKRLPTYNEANEKAIRRQIIDSIFS